MSEKTADAEAIGAFIDRWERSGAAERSNHQLFISELCDLLGVSHPDPATPDSFSGQGEEDSTVYRRPSAKTTLHGLYSVSDISGQNFSEILASRLHRRCF